MKGPITISSSLKSKFNKKSLEEVLHLGIILSDEGSLEYMKDNSPVKFLYLLPFSLYVEAVIPPQVFPLLYIDKNKVIKTSTCRKGGAN